MLYYGCVYSAEIIRGRIPRQNTFEVLYFSVIILIVVSIGMKHLSLTEWVYYAVLLVAALIVLVLSPVEYRNKPLDEIEHKVYKKRAVFILAAELLIGLALRLAGFGDLFTAVIYSFAVLSVMLLLGWVKNKRIKKD